MKSDRQKINFLNSLFFKVNDYATLYGEDLDKMVPEIVQYDACSKQIKSCKNLISQFEKSGKYENTLDKLYVELIFLSAAYEYAVYISTYSEAIN